MNFFKPGVSCLGRALERSQKSVPCKASLQAQGGKSVDLGQHDDAGLRRTRCQLVGNLPIPCHLLTIIMCTVIFAQGSTWACGQVSFQRSVSPFLEMLSWTAARSDGISCYADLGRDTSTQWAPGSLILPVSLDPQALVLSGRTDSAQQVRRSQQVLHAAFSTYNPQLTASALARSPSAGEMGICGTDKNQNDQTSHLARYVQIMELILRWLSL